MDRDISYRKAVGNAIRAIRRDAGLTQAEFSNRVGLNHQATLSNYERGQRDVPLEVVAAISREFGVQVSQIVDSFSPDLPGGASESTGTARHDCDREFDEIISEIAELLNKAEESHPGMAEGFLLLLREGYLDTPEDVEVVLSVAEILRERVRKGTL